MSAKTQRDDLELHRVTSEEGWRRVREIRQRVFVEEQECPPEDEWDEFDGHATGARHLLGYWRGRPVATARWRVVEESAGPVAKLERFAVLPEARGKGFGRQMVALALEEARRAGHRRFLLYAQAHLEAFYGEFGFEKLGEPFDEAGIPHIEMRFDEPLEDSG